MDQELSRENAKGVSSPSDHGAKVGFWIAYLKFRQEFDPAEVDLDVEGAFGDRDRTVGRDFEW